MFDLILAVVTSAAVSILMRLSGDKAKNSMALLLVSYLTSTLICVFHMGPGVLTAPHPELPKAAAMAVVSGFLYMSGFVLMQYNIPRNGVVQTSTYMRLGLVVCVVLSVLLFGELPTALQVAGFVLAVAAIILNGSKARPGKGWFNPGLVLVLLSGGFVDTWIKAFNVYCDPALSDRFLMMTFLVAAGLCLAAMLYKKQRIGWWELLFGAAIAIPNYYNSRFVLKALEQLPSVIVYPTYSVGTLLLITVLGVCFFKERLSRRQWAAMTIILAALALLNL